MWIHRSLIACENCASICRQPDLEPGETAACARCGTTLWRYSGLTLSNWLALTLAALIVFVLANAPIPWPAWKCRAWCSGLRCSTPSA